MKWLFGGLLFAIGVLVGWLSPAFRKITFNNEVDAGNVLNAVIVLIVAFVFQYLYTDRSSSRQNERSLLLESLRDAKTAMERLHDCASPCHSGKKLTQPQQTELALREREFSNAVHSFEEAVKCCKVKAHEIGLDKLKDARTELKDSLTDTPYPGPYDAAARNRIHGAFKNVRDQLTLVSFAVNRR